MSARRICSLGFFSLYTHLEYDVNPETIPVSIDTLFHRL